MEHIIAYNPYKNGNKGSVSSQPLSVYDKTIAYPWMADLVAAIRGGNDELKKQLPFRCAHYYQFRDNRLRHVGSMVSQRYVSLDSSWLSKV
jgi:hypothetical protein